MCKISVAIRVFNRLDDLRCIVDIINNTWKDNKYDVFVISNGLEEGYDIPNEIENAVFKTIKLRNNDGHQSGTSQMLLAFWDNIDFKRYEYSIIIEADTWLYGDSLVSKYLKRMDENKDVVYTAAKWYDKYYSLATDFAIIRNSFLKENRDLFRFDDKAECHMANYVMDHGAKFMYIKENMLPNLPSYINKYPYTQKGRFVCFPSSKIVTHHIEILDGGLEEKKRLFNAISGKRFFERLQDNGDKFERWRMYFFFYLSKLLLRQTWYSSTIKMLE